MPPALATLAAFLTRFLSYATHLAFFPDTFTSLAICLTFQSAEAETFHGFRPISFE